MKVNFMKKALLSILLLLSVATLSFSQVVVNQNITTNTTWTNDKIYQLEGGFIYVINNAVLTIEPGTIIKGNASALVVTRGAKLLANGEPERPIVFTSYKKVGERATGDWGGILLLGKAKVNCAGGECTAEGGIDATYAKYGGTDDEDNSGSLKYVRIEFGGIAFQPNNETNGLTLAGVGRGTTLEHIQSSYGGDDAFEWFGGTVNSKYLVVFKTLDDMFDTDFGFSGKNQFLLGISDPQIADVSGSNGFESDNDAQGSTNEPKTNATFSNVTILGPKKNATTVINGNFKRGMHLRRSTELDIFNTVITGFPVGLRLESTNSENNYLTDNKLELKGLLLAGMAKSVDSTSTNSPAVKVKFTSDAAVNILPNVADAGIPNFDEINPFLPSVGSPALTGSDFTSAKLNDPFFEKTTYRGAFGTADWTKCWCEFDPQNANYEKSINNAVAVSITATTTKNLTYAFVANGTAGVTYTWNFGDGKTSSEANPTHKYDKAGNYTVAVTAVSPKGCNRTTTYNIVVTKVQEVEGLQSVQLSPNPTNATATLQFDLAQTTDLAVIVSNIAGQTVYTEKNTFNEGTNTVNIETSNWAEGIYFVRLQSKEGVKTLKLSVQR
ncbi:MAG: hypothetical protein RLZZ292_1113 [Bacteroidota bacterium]|jgi:PKD repeat protein